MSQLAAKRRRRQFANGFRRLAKKHRPHYSRTAPADSRTGKTTKK